MKKSIIHVLAATFLVSNAYCPAGISAEAPAAEAAVSEAPKAADATPAAKSLVWMPTLLKSQHSAAADGKPLLVCLTAAWNRSCRKLIEEFEKPEMQSELARWTLALIDIDLDPDDAARLNAVVVPGLRIRTPGGQLVAARDGLLPAEELLAWLKKGREAALAQPEEVLLASGKPNAAAINHLIRQFEDRSPEIRAAAIRLLLPHPDAAADSVVKAFIEGHLVVRLSALELLRQWKAPIANIDPWQMETFTSEKKLHLAMWADKAADMLIDPPEKLSDEQLAQADAQIEQMIKAADEESDDIRERLAQLGPELLPRVYQRLIGATAERDHQRLLMLRYRLATNGSLELRWPDGLQRLTSADPLQRREAAEELAQRATAEDHRLLLELFSDPVVRECCLLGLLNIGGKEAVGTLADLLADPEPSVRAAALKLLEATPQPEIVPKIAAYLKTEKDQELIIQAIRCLRAAGGAQAMIDLLRDSDDFIASRTMESLSKTNMESVVEPLVQAIEKRPDMAKKILPMLAIQDKTKPIAIPFLRKFCKHPDAAIRAAAIAGLLLASPEGAGEEIAAALQDPDGNVRISAAGGFFHVMEQNYLGKERPEWIKPLVAPLEKMLSADSAEEKLNAALALVSLGKPVSSSKGGGALPVLLESVRADRKLFEAATAVLPWLDWNERLDAFRQFRRLAADGADIKPLLGNMIKINDRRAIGVFWELLSDEKITPEVAAAATSSLLKLYQIDLKGSSPEAIALSRQEAMAAAKPRIAARGELQRLSALIILANVSPEEGAVMAAGLAEDSGLNEQLRRDAFQIMLAVQPDRKASGQAAVAALSGEDMKRKKIALELLAGDIRSLCLVRGSFTLSASLNAESTVSHRGGEPIVPKAPDGVEAKHVKPLLEDKDSEVAARAGYLLALLGEAGGMDAIVNYWRAHEADCDAQRLVYRAAAALNDEKYVPALREISVKIDENQVSDFYWTIRGMSGSEILKLRKEIRDKVGMSRLQ
jgi:HEAT repeat protein